MTCSSHIARAVLSALFILFSLFSQPPAFARPALKDYAALPAIQMMSVSPDGKHLGGRTT